MSLSPPGYVVNAGSNRFCHWHCVTSQNWPQYRPHSDVVPLTRSGAEGYLIRSASLNGHAVTVIAANSDIGALYGSFAFLRLIQTRQTIAHLDLGGNRYFEMVMTGGESSDAVGAANQEIVQILGGIANL